MQTSCLLVFSLRVIIIYYLFVEDALYMGLDLNSLHLYSVYIPANNLVSRCSRLRSVTLASLDVIFLASVGITYAVFRKRKTITVLNQLSGRCGYFYIRNRFLNLSF